MYMDIYLCASVSLC
ncbi:hypothetical protein NFI96_012728, partial [Prochilodus magdalenae]